MKATARSWVIPLSLVLLTASVRVVPAAVIHQGRVSDFVNMEEMADAVLRGDNIYARTLLFPYAPYSQFMQGGMKLLAHKLSLRFEFVVKLAPIAADCIVVLLLLYAPFATSASRRVCAFVWAINPVSILITAFHGNIMPVVAMLIVASTIAFDHDPERKTGSIFVTASALLLGLAIAIRSFPVLFLPLFVFKLRNHRERIRFLALALFATAFSSLPYLLFAPKAFIREVLGYSGVPDFGWAAIIRALTREGQLATITDYAPTETKVLFLLAYAVWLCVIAIRDPEQPVTATSVTIPLLFFCIYSGVAAHYLIWLLPLALTVGDRRMITLFSLGSTLALVGFYATYHPILLFGQFTPILGGMTARGLWFVGNVILFGVCLLSSIRVFRGLLGGTSLPMPLRLARIAMVGIFSAWLGVVARTALHVL